MLCRCCLYEMDYIVQEHASGPCLYSVCLLLRRKYRVKVSVGVSCVSSVVTPVVEEAVVFGFGFGQTWVVSSAWKST